MAFEEQEKRRMCEIICEEMQKGTGMVESRDILARLREEDIHPGPGDMEAYLMLLRDSGAIIAAMPFGREEIEEHGNMVITSFSTEFLETYGS